MDGRTTVIRAATIGVLLLVLTGCTVKLTDFTLLATKEVDPGRMAELQRGGTKAQGEDSLHIILFLPMEKKLPMSEAVNKAIGSVPGCVALADGTITLENGYLFLLAGYVAYEVVGIPLIDQRLKAELPSRYIVMSYDRGEERFVTEYVSRERYEAVRDGADSGRGGRP